METSWKPHNEKLRQVESIAAFASYIEEYLVPDHAKLNVELLEAIGRWKDESEGVANTNHRGWHSPRTLFDRGEDALIALGRHIRTGLAHSVRRYWPDFHPARHRVALDAWANVNGKGAFNSPHNHEGAHLSGSYYVSVPPSDDDSSGALEFLNPIGGGWPTLPSGGHMIRPTMFLKPKAGSMIIFPSYLRHWVYPNQEEAERVSVAFNLRLVDAGVR